MMELANKAAAGFSPSGLLLLHFKINEPHTGRHWMRGRPARQRSGQPWRPGCMRRRSASGRSRGWAWVLLHCCVLKCASPAAAASAV